MVRLKKGILQIETNILEGDNTWSILVKYEPSENSGCSGVTYDNYCVADSSGITSYVAGECCD